MQLADADGIDKMSMRRLATELDCGVMSLYHYVADKDALIEALVDQVASEVAPPAADTPWREAAQELAAATLAAQLNHPWVISIWSMTWPGPHRFALIERLLEALAQADLPADIADLGFHALTNHIQGFAQQRLAFGQLEAQADETAGRVAAIMGSDEFPRVIDHIAFHQHDETDRDEFRFTLDLILDGLERHAS